MLLRRITEHVKTQNWFAVAVDFLIVVFGIFAGFQVDNWNEDRKRAAQEQSYLVRLQTDLEATIRMNEHQIDFMMSQGQRSGLVLRSLRDCNLPETEREDFANGLFHLGKVFPVYLIKSTINELVSTGKIDIIRSENVRTQLDGLIETYEHRYALTPLITERITPPVIYVDTQYQITIDTPQVGNIEISWKDIEIDFAKLCNDRRFSAAVSAVRNYTYDVIAQNTQVLKEVRNLHRLLELEIDRSTP